LRCNLILESMDFRQTALADPEPELKGNQRENEQSDE
jgi:hypothetical protein